MNRLAAFEINQQAVDRTDFYRVACDPRRSVVVEACAGAGKTWMLVSRMVRALLDGAQPQDILAITFTKKAAGEMRQRLQEWLREFAQADDAALRQALRERGVTDDADTQQVEALRQLYGSLLRSGRSVQVRTFHSWFAALLRAAPLHLLDAMGLPAQYELLENDALAVERVWGKFHARVAQDPQLRDDYLWLVQTHGRYQTQRALESGLSKRVEFAMADAQGVVDASVAPMGELFPEFEGWDDPLQRLLDPAVEVSLWAVAKLLGSQTQSTPQKAASALERALTERDAAGVLNALLTASAPRGPRKFSDKMVGVQDVRDAQDLCLRALQAQAQNEAWQHQRRMARLMRCLAQDYAALKREQGWIDMSDLEQAALTLLSDPVISGWVQERLDAQVRHVLIDEFQDTNPLQWQALSAWLSGYAGAGHAPSVFIVGDPKQSIYRFRRAEPQVFQAAKQFVVQGLGGDVLSCDHTRRNAPKVVDAVNAVMDAAQSEGAFEGFRDHTTESTALGLVLALPRLARSKADATDDPSPTWRDTLTVPRVEEQDTLKTMECRQAAQWLQTQLLRSNGSLQPSHVMVLARKRERLALMQAELSALGIAALQPEKTELCEMPEVQDVVAVLDALVSVQHDLSLARALKSPILGASDQDLLHLALCKRAWIQAQAAQVTQADGGTPAATVSWWQLLQSQADLPAALLQAREKLVRWQHWVQTLPPHDALHALYADGDVVARMGAAAPDALRSRVIANVRAVLHVALALDGGRYSTMYALVRALRSTGWPAPQQADAQAVRLLTVHGAKGLEAPLVLLLDTDGESPRSDTMGVLVQWPGEAPHPVRFIFLTSESQPPACAIEAMAQEQAARRREELNALYVALTRARSTVVLSAIEPHRAVPGSWWERVSAQAQAVVWPDPQGNGGHAAVAPQDAAQAPTFTLWELPLAHAVLQRPGDEPDAPAAAQAQPLVQDSLESRMGQAMHRFLEWVGLCDAAEVSQLWSSAQRHTVGQAFDLTAEQVERAQAMAWAIVQGQAAWAWQGAQVAWWSNEVPITVGGRVLRMDRLVQRKDTQAWWVLDYKSASRPQDQADLRAQLLAYREAVRRSGVAEPVYAAFLTPQGALIDVDTA